MARTTVTATCPHCEAEIEVRVETEAEVATPFVPPFTSEQEFERWLKASRLTVEEVKRLPFYEWHRDQLEPLTRALGEDAADEATDEWHRDQVRPLTRGVADEADAERSHEPRV